MRPQRGFTYYLSMFGVLVGVFAIVLPIIDNGLGDPTQWRKWLAILVASAMIAVGAWVEDRGKADKALEKARRIIRGESDPTD